MAGASERLPCRIPHLDGLRGVAIALVVAFHYVTFSARYEDHAVANVLVRLLSFGWSGVELFFVLSGFLIGGILLDVRGARNYSRAFYLRLVCRIFALYFVLLGISFATPAAVQANDSVAGLRDVFPEFLDGVHNRGFDRRGESNVVADGGGTILPAIRLINPELMTADFVLLPCRMDALLLGVAAAYFVPQERTWEILRQRRKELWSVIEVLTVVCALLLLTTPGTSPTLLFQVVGYDCLDLLYVCLLLACLIDQRLARVLKKR